MKKRKITQKDVFEACENILKKGENEKITNEKIRHEIKAKYADTEGGNEATIGKYAKDWIALQSDEEIKKLRRQRRSKSELQPKQYPFFGTDFRYRITGEKFDELAKIIKGYWEMYTWAFSRENVIMRSLLIFKEKNKYDALECELISRFYSYKGCCFALEGGLVYMFLDSCNKFSEITTINYVLPQSFHTYATNSNEPILQQGIITCLSATLLRGEVDIPAASKGAFRYLNQGEKAIREEYAQDGLQDNSLTLDQFLREHTKRDFDPQEFPKKNELRKSIFELIDNSIIPGKTSPFVLRAKS